ncbi:fucolectin-6-like [Mytilus californianus]|uniref:fucolectin-6-like n=1 Tax=Mytilus californianus TaxID=6549 RepID=UPI00224857C3|nr:fucolectin-6-like [Mytilus californianus]
MESGEVNIALSMPATQSSTYENPDIYGATFATDGLVPKLQYGYLCTHTRGEFTPWLSIDLQDMFKIKKVVLVNRQDENDSFRFLKLFLFAGQRLHDVEVRAGLDGVSFPGICGTFVGPGFTGQSVNILCQKKTIGRFVRAQIVKGGPEYLTLCEMEIYTDK